MTNNILPIEIDEELVSSVRATCVELDVELEKLVKDYLDFVTGLEDSEIDQVKEFSNKHEKAEWLAKYYFDVRANQLKSFEVLKNEVLIGHNQINEDKVTSLEEVRHEFD